ncbi:10476_t:CDS:2, partial [Acaulospora morrowiae]
KKDVVVMEKPLTTHEKQEKEEYGSEEQGELKMTVKELDITLQPICEMPTADDPTLMQDHGKIDNIETIPCRDKIESKCYNPG